jgi:hypothetical protein
MFASATLTIVPSTRSVRTVGADERRARSATRHRLVPSLRSASVVEVGRDLAALHATDPATVHLAAAAWRLAPRVASVERRRLVSHIDQGGVSDDGDAWLQRIGDATVAALELTTWLGPARVTPRFRTPLERELVGGP